VEILWELHLIDEEIGFFGKGYGLISLGRGKWLSSPDAAIEV
jgi:hypothetical protein